MDSVETSAAGGLSRVGQQWTRGEKKALGPRTRKTQGVIVKPYGTGVGVRALRRPSARLPLLGPAYTAYNACWRASHVPDPTVLVCHEAAVLLSAANVAFCFTGA